MQNYIQSLALQILPKHKGSPSGWVNFNCPACTHNNQARPDTRGRGGFRLLPDGGIKYHCFNCKFKSSWHPGLYLSKRIKKMLSWMGASQDQIRQASLEAFKIKESGEYNIAQSLFETQHLEKSQLPRDSKTMISLLESGFDDPDFLNCVDYLLKRNENLLNWYDKFYWSPEHKDRFIVPLVYQDTIYGWTARFCGEDPEKKKAKYLSDNKIKFLFNADRLFDENRKYVIVTEGPLDAISISGVSLLGSEISDTQIQWINSCDKEVIVLADRDKDGRKLIEKAVQEGWYVSFPPFDMNINDAFDAVNYYGRLATIKLIIDNIESNPLKINIKTNEWM